MKNQLVIQYGLLGFAAPAYRCSVLDDKAAVVLFRVKCRLAL
jgi:hypothetical protein